MKDMGTYVNPEVLHINAGVETRGDNELDKTENKVVAREDKVSEPLLQPPIVDKNRKKVCQVS